MHNVVSKHPNTIITGEPGVGKTALIKDYEEKFSNSFIRIGHYHVFELNEIYNFIDNWILSNLKDGGLLIIDDLDEFLENSEKSKLALTLKNINRYGIKIIGIGRDITPLRLLPTNAVPYRLGNLTISEVDQLIQQVASNNNLDLQETSKLKESTHYFRGNPIAIQNFLSLLKYTKLNDTQNIISNKINYKNRIIIQPEIIKNIEVVNFIISNRIKDDPAYLHTITPRQFEEIVADLFTKKGFEVQLTPQTRDGGKDMYILKHEEYGKCYTW